MSTANRARPSRAPSCSPAAGRPARRPPTWRQPAPDTAPTGTSPARTSARKDKTPHASRASPNRCATAAPRPHRSRTPNYPTPNTAAATRARSHPAAAAGYQGSPAPSTASPNHQHPSEHDEPQAGPGALAQQEPRASHASPDVNDVLAEI